MKQLARIIVILILIGGLIFLNFQNWLRVPKSLIYKIFLPAQFIFSKVSHQVADFFSLFFEIKSLKEQNKKLIEENRQLLAEAAKVSFLERENHFLKKELNLKEDKSYFNFILADIISLDIQNPRQVIFINKGSADGIKPGQAVVLAGKILVGKVKEVYDKISKIETLFNFSSRFNVITEKSRISGVINANNFGIFMDFIDPKKEIIPGEKIFTAGSLDNFPKGLLIGVVSKVFERDSQIFKKAEVSLSYEIKDIDQVLIIANN